MKNKKRTHILFISILILILISSYFIYNFIFSPRFAIYRIQTAIENKDKEMFLKFVNLDSIIDDFFQQIILEESKEIYSNNPIEHYKVQLKIKLMERFKPEIKNYLKNLILSYFDSSQNHSSLPQIAESFFLKKIESLTIPIHIIMQYSIEKIYYQENQISIIEYKIIPENAPPLILKLKFKKENLYWKLIALPNLYETILKLNELKY
jgi:hypothetical protein